MVKAVVFTFLPAALLVFAVSCGGSSSAVKAGAPAVKISASAERMPDWVLKKKKAAGDVYFVGMSTRLTDLKEARKSSIDDATRQLVEYIGIRATTRFRKTKEMTEMNNVDTFKETVNQTIEGKGSAKVSVDVEDVYYEQYSDNTYTIYSLIKFPQDWVEKERKRLQKLTADQRARSSVLLKEAAAALDKGDVSKSLDLGLSALSISEKAAENSDIYDECKSLIALVLSGLSFTLETPVRYAYAGGGSEPVAVVVKSSRTGGPVSGVMLALEETSSNARTGSKTGNISDASGRSVFEVRTVLNDARQLNMAVSFALAKFEAVSRMDEEFYRDLVKLRDSQALAFSLTVSERSKVIPTALFVAEVRVDRNGKYGEVDTAREFQDALSGDLANEGFNITPVSVPLSVWRTAAAEKQLRSSVASYIGKNSPSVRRIAFGVLSVNTLGRIGEDVKFSTYDINTGDLVSVEVNFVLSLVDLETGKMEEGKKIMARSYGLNAEQASRNAQRVILEKYREQAR